MDGPYQRAYGEVIYSLSEEQRGRLEELAFMSLEEPVLLDIILVERAAARPRPEFEPVFRRLARPPLKAFWPEDATRAFLLAAIGLSRLDAEIPVADAQTGAVAAWWALAEIFCQTFSLGAPNEERIRQAWSRLCGLLIDDALDQSGISSGRRPWTENVTPSRFQPFESIPLSLGRSPATIFQNTKRPETKKTGTATVACRPRSKWSESMVKGGTWSCYAGL